jgi:RNA polymerase sigma-70 factor (ECF subfamily)
MIRPATRVSDDRMTKTIDLFRRAQLDDEVARDRLMSRCYKDMLGCARHHMPWGRRSLLESQDIVQMAMIKAQRNLKKIKVDGDDGFRKYLRTAIKHLVVDVYRANGRRPPKHELQDGFTNGTKTPEEAAIENEQRGHLERALGSLKGHQRELIILRCLREMSHAEVAAELGKKPDAVRIGTGRALEKLAALMTDMPTTSGAGKRSPGIRRGDSARRRKAPSRKTGANGP